jgi:hypothetical protein
VKIHTFDQIHALLRESVCCFPGRDLIGKGFFTFTGKGKGGGTGDPDGHHPVRFKLVQAVQGIKAPFITSPDQYPEHLVWIPAGNGDQYLVQRIPGIPGIFSVPET